MIRRWLRGDAKTPAIRAPRGTLAIHIGDFKTGSTSIQHALSRGLATSGDTQLYWPGGPDHRTLAQTLGDKRHVPHRDARWRDLADRLAGADPWDIATISSEQFEFYPPERLAAALAQWLPEYAESARLIVYVRPHASRFLSSCAEHLKQGFTLGPLEERYEWLLQRKTLFYAERLGRWRAVFGDRLTIRPLVRSELRNQDVVADFFHWLFGGARFDCSDSAEQNPSMTVQDLSVMREIHGHLIAKTGVKNEHRHALGWQIARYVTRLSQPQTAPVYLRLHNSLAERLVADYKADAEALDLQIFGKPLFAPALQSAVANALTSAQPLDAASWHDAATLRLIEGWADILAEALTRCPDEFLRALDDGPLDGI